MLTLGEKLVEELKLVESTDTLARWMAHYVAELIVRARAAPASERERAEHECAQAILDLWGKAAAFPTAHPPFESIDRVAEALESLDPHGQPRYHNDLWRALKARSRTKSDEVGTLLETASAIDGAARNLIHHVVAHASNIAGRDCSDWLKLVQQLDQEDPLTELRIRIVEAGVKEASLEEYRVVELESRIAQLEKFSAASDALRRELRKALETAKAKAE